MGNLAILLHLLYCFFPELPDSVDVLIRNQAHADITSVNLLFPHDQRLHPLPFETPLQAGESRLVKFPYRFVNLVICTTPEGFNYTRTAFQPTGESPELDLTLSDKEFGHIFDRIYGRYPAALTNDTPMPIIAIMGSEPLPQGNLLSGRMLLPGEFLRVWADSGEFLEFKAVTVSMDTSSSVTATAFSIDTVFAFETQHFLDNGVAYGDPNSCQGIWICNVLNQEIIILAEAFDPEGYLISGIDCSASPLDTWDRLWLPLDAQPSYVVCTDRNGRTFTISEPDSNTGIYLFDELALDFGYDFPGRR